MVAKVLKSRLVDIQQKDGSKIGTDIILKRLDCRKNVTIEVDESLQRVCKRFIEQYQGDDSRDGVYLSNGMLNIDVNTENDEWMITNGNGIYYAFSKSDVSTVLDLETTNIIKCPYCGFETIPWDYVETGDMEGDFPLDCEKCGKEFNVGFRTEMKFVSSVIEK